MEIGRSGGITHNAAITHTLHTRVSVYKAAVERNEKRRQMQTKQEGGEEKKKKVHTGVLHSTRPAKQQQQGKRKVDKPEGSSSC